MYYVYKIGTIHDDLNGKSYDIFPVVKKNSKPNKTKRSAKMIDKHLYNSDMNTHVLFLRREKILSQNHYYTFESIRKDYGFH